MPFFEPLRKIVDVFIKFNPNDIIFQVIGTNKEFQEEILDLNRIDQLFLKGEDSKGNDLNAMTQSGYGYSAYTKAIKRRKNQPTNRVTLFDTGAFYKSFRLIVAPSYIEFTADAQKDGSNLFDDFGNDIIGLSEEGLEVLRTKLIPLILNHLNSRLI